ncbi:hypothetical protein IJX73_00060 [bacterium]|nr:hypothetical protein [bacterium]MBQ9149304.1 hypothetical protein [bacterium]
MKKSVFILIAILILNQVALAVVYECTYKTKNGATIASSFNPFHKHRPEYPALYAALKVGNCKELHVKRYFIDATSCNIQFYKHNMQIANLACAGNRESALNKLKEIAKKDYGYKGK